MEYRIYFRYGNEEYNFSVPVDHDKERVFTKDDDLRLLGDMASNYVKCFLNEKALLKKDENGESQCYPTDIRFFSISNKGETLLWDGKDFQDNGTN